MESKLYKKYISRKIDPVKLDEVDLGTVKTTRHMMPNGYKEGKPIQLDAVDLGTVQTKKHYMPDSYEKGDFVDEDDFENSFKAKGEFPQLSVQDYSTIKKDKKGNSYVTKLKEE